MQKIKLSNWESRFWAWLIDMILIGGLSSLIAGSLGFLDHTIAIPFVDIASFEASNGRFSFNIANALFNVTSFGVSGFLLFAYWTILEGYKGQSIGKMALNLKVTDRKGEKIGYRVAALQSFGKAFILALDCIVGWLAMPNTKLRLFNRISNTIVIRTNYEPPPDVQYIKEKD